MLLPSVLRQPLQHGVEERLQRIVRDAGLSAVKPVVGFFGLQKQGKSSLINALLNVPDIVPEDALPASATQCKLTWADQAATTLRYGADTFSVAFEERHRYLDQNRLSDGPVPEEVEIRYPAQLLNAFDVVDAPGYGSVISEHTERAGAALRNIDCLVLVCSSFKTIGADDLQPLREASRRGLPIFVALTKVDQLELQDDPEGDLERLLLQIRIVTNQSGIHLSDVFAVSVRRPRAYESETAIADLRCRLVAEAGHLGVRAALRHGLDDVLAGVEELPVSLADLAQRIKACELEIQQAELTIAQARVPFTNRATRVGEEQQQALKDIEMFALARGERIITDALPDSSAVNRPEAARDQWRLTCDRMHDSLASFINDIQVEVRKYAEALPSVGPAGGALTRLATAALAFGGQRMDKRTPTLDEPGLFSISLGLHGQYVQRRFAEVIGEWLESISHIGERYEAAVDLAVGEIFNAIVEQVATDESKALSPLLEHRRRWEAAREDLNSTIAHRSHQLEEKRREAARLGAIYKKVCEISDGWRRVTYGSPSAKRNELFASIACEPIELAVAFDTDQLEAALGLLESSIQRPGLSMDEYCMLGRAYWIAKLRSMEIGADDPVGRGIPTAAQADAIGHALWTLGDHPDVPEDVRLLISACCAESLEDRAGLELLPQDLRIAVLLLYDSKSAARASATELRSYGFSASLKSIREFLDDRARGGQTRALATCLPELSSTLLQPDATVDLLPRLVARAAGISPDFGSFPSFR